MAKAKEIADEILGRMEPARERVVSTQRDPQEHVDFQPNVELILSTASEVDHRFGGQLDEEKVTRGSGASRILHVGLNLDAFVPVTDFEITTRLSVQGTVMAGKASFTKEEVVGKIREGLGALT